MINIFFFIFFVGADLDSRLSTTKFRYLFLELLSLISCFPELKVFQLGLPLKFRNFISVSCFEWESFLFCSFSHFFELSIGIWGDWFVLLDFKFHGEASIPLYELDKSFRFQVLDRNKTNLFPFLMLTAIEAESLFQIGLFFCRMQQSDLAFENLRWIKI